MDKLSEQIFSFFRLSRRGEFCDACEDKLEMSGTNDTHHLTADTESERIG
jgi:hypothetical protein